MGRQDKIQVPVQDVERALAEGGPVLRALLAARLRARSLAAVKKLGELIDVDGAQRSTPQVALAASRAVLALWEKAEAQVENDRLERCEAILRELGHLPPLPGDVAQPAPPANP